MPENRRENGDAAAVAEHTPNIGNVLRRLRGERTLRKVENDTGIRNGYISRLETGASRPGVKTLTRLAAYYGVNARNLLWQAGLVKDEHLNPEYDNDDVERSYRFLLDDPRLKAYAKPEEPLPMEAKRFVVEIYQTFAGKQLL